MLYIDGKDHVASIAYLNSLLMSFIIHHMAIFYWSEISTVQTSRTSPLIEMVTLADEQPMRCIREKTETMGINC